MLGPVENIFGRFGLIETLRHDRVCGIYHLAKQGFLPDKFNVVIDVNQMRNAVEKTGQIHDTASRLELR